MDPETRESIGRLENKDDAIVTALDRLTRIEERYHSQTQTLTRHEAWLADHETRIRSTEGGEAVGRVTTSSNSTLIWAVIAALGFVGGLMVKGALAL